MKKLLFVLLFIPFIMTAQDRVFKVQGTVYTVKDSLLKNNLLSFVNDSSRCFMTLQGASYYTAIDSTTHTLKAQNVMREDIDSTSILFRNAFGKGIDLVIRYNTQTITINMEYSTNVNDSLPEYANEIGVLWQTTFLKSYTKQLSQPYPVSLASCYAYITTHSVSNYGYVVMSISYTNDGSQPQSICFGGSVRPYGTSHYDFTTYRDYVCEYSIPVGDTRSFSNYGFNHDTYVLAPNTTYWGTGAAQLCNGDCNNYCFGNNITFTTASSAPTVTVNTPTNITATGATFTGYINPYNASYTYKFQVSTDNTNWSDVSTGNGTVAQNVSYTCSSLNSGTNYYYRITATNATGTTNGTTQSFTTLSGENTKKAVYISMFHTP